MNEDAKTIKTSFYNIVVCHSLDAVELQEMADNAGVLRVIVDKIFINVAVRRTDAIKVLAALSKCVGQAYTLDNVRVALSPTFSELHTTHNFDLSNLAMHAGVPYAIVDMMLNGHAVPIKEARLVLQMASRLSGQNYTLDTVDIATEETNNG